MAREKVAAFHIGAHKTGTSVLQQYLKRQAAALAGQRLNVLTRAELGKYVSWGEALVESPERLVGRLTEFMADSRFDVLFGSNENALGRPFLRGARGGFYPRGPRNIRALARTIRGDCRPRIFLSVRPQADFLESYYLQTVHEGSSISFRRWLDHIDLDRLSWHPLVQALNDWFGPENVHIIDFRTISDGQDVFIRRFLSALGDRYDHQVRFTATVNRSYSEKALRMALAANPYLAGSPDRAALRRFLQQHFSNVDYPRPVLLTDEERRSITDRYADEYEALTTGALGVTSGPERS